MKPADDIPGVGRFAILTDPQGAGFAIIKLENPQV
jgi:predicted enzyme related to lactoylglutathione lyase